jgi:hypothetical protein
MTIELDHARTLLRTLIRSIDKKVDFMASASEGDTPGVSVALSRQTHHATIVIPQEQIDAAEGNTIYRSQLRTVLKRAIDRMTFRQTDFASTKMVRGAVTDGGFFRSQTSGYRSGRR